MCQNFQPQHTHTHINTRSEPLTQIQTGIFIFRAWPNGNKICQLIVRWRALACGRKRHPWCPWSTRWEISITCSTCRGSLTKRLVMCLVVLVPRPAGTGERSECANEPTKTLGFEMFPRMFLAPPPRRDTAKGSPCSSFISLRVCEAHLACAFETEKPCKGALV